MPENLAPLEPFLPLAPLGRLVSEGAPRWAYSCLAADMAGPWRRVPRLGQQVLESGTPALPERPRQIHDGWREVRTASGTVREPMYRDGPLLPAQAAVPPLRRPMEAAGTEEALTAVLTVLDGLAGQEPGKEPDCPPELVCESWPVMRTVISGHVPPPLRWTPPSPRPRRPELAALYPAAPHPRVVGVPRVAPPFRRPGGLVEMDGRLLAVQALLRHAAVQGAQPELEDVARVLGWIVGRERAVAPVVGRGSFAKEWALPGVTEAERELATVDPVRLAGELLAPGLVSTGD